jgi:serine/threonine protein kinase
MRIQPGTRLGPYEVGRLLGVGGMGEVYLAHDTRLRRDVAVKVLPIGQGTDDFAVARLEREAEVQPFHYPQVRSMGLWQSGAAGTSMGKDSIVISKVEASGNIWMAEVK